MGAWETSAFSYGTVLAIKTAASDYVAVPHDKAVSWRRIRP
jgi:hypothetical protein